MTESLVALPRGWCAGKVFLDAQSQSTTKYIVVGTPFAISWLDYYKDSFLGLFGLFMVTFLFAVGLLILPDAIHAIYSEQLLSVAAGFVVFGVAGYAMFFVYFHSFVAGRTLSALLLALELVLYLWLAAYRRCRLKALCERWKRPVTCWAVVALVAFCLSTATNDGAGPWTVNAFFDPVRWSSDNQLPMQISEYLFQGLDPRTLNLGPWTVSDRPPLAYGLMSMFRLLSWLIAPQSNGNALYYQYQQLIGIVINGLWVVAVYELVAKFEHASTRVYWLLLVVAATPFAIFNSAYIWPKMLGGAFGLMAFVELVRPDVISARSWFQRHDAGFVWAAALSALALMSHGGTAFGVFAAILVAIYLRGLPSLRYVFWAVLSAVVILVPWLLWQHIEQPPGDALVKFTFSGHYGFQHPNEGLLATVRRAYAGLSIAAWARMKLHALEVLVMGVGSACGVQEMAPIHSFGGLLRTRDFFYFVPSLRFLVLGFIPLLVPHKPLSLEKQTVTSIRIARILVATGILSIALYSLSSFHCYINHTQSYQALLEVIAGLVVALYYSYKWYWRLAIYLSITYGVIVWVLEPLANAASLYALPLIGLAAIGSVVYYYFSSDAARIVGKLAKHP